MSCGSADNSKQMKAFLHAFACNFSNYSVIACYGMCYGMPIRALHDSCLHVALKVQTLSGVLKRGQITWRREVHSWACVLEPTTLVHVWSLKLATPGKGLKHTSDPSIPQHPTAELEQRAAASFCSGAPSQTQNMCESKGGNPERKAC